MQFGLMFFASSEEVLTGDNKYHLVIESAKFADQHGFSSLWVPERHFTKFGSLYPNPAVLHAALARETQHIRLRAGSVVVPIHNPIRIAEEWAVVDNLSKGRVGISFAPGWNPDDFAFFPERYQDRHQEMFSGIQLVQKFWQGESISATNGNGNQIDIQIYPKPIQKELPVWLTAAGSPQTFIKAGEIGANLLTHLLDQSIEQLAEKIALYRQARAKHGHTPETGVVTVMLHTFVGEDMNIVREQVRAPYCEYLKSNIGLLKNLGSSRNHSVNIADMSPKDLDDFVNFLFERFASSRGLIGTPETCVHLLKELDSVGVDEAACLLDFGPNSDLILKHLPYLNQLKECYNVAALNGYSTLPEILTTELSFSGNSTNGANSTTLELPEQIQARCQQEIPGSDFYNKLREYSVQLEASYQGIQHIWRRDGEALGLVQLLEELKPSADAYKIHPAFLDACFQVLVAALPTYSLSNNGGTLYIPAGLRSLQVYDAIDKQVWSHAVLGSSVSDSADKLEGDVYIRDRKGKMLVKASGLQLRRTETARPLSSQQTLNDWFYKLQWETTSLPEINNPLPGQRGSWLIFTDSSGVGDRLAALLTARGETCFMVSPSEVYQVSQQRQFWLNPNSSEQMRQLIENVLGANQPLCRGVIHLWSLNETFAHEMTLSSLENSQVLGVSSVLSLLQSLSNVKQSVLPRLWLVTKGAQSLGTESSLPAIAQTPLWGLGKTCAAEHSDLWGGMVDLDPQASKDEAVSQLLNVICGEDVEDQLVFRYGKPHVARLVQKRESVEHALSFSWRKDCSYLLTGGLGGIGLQVAQWIVEQGAQHLILLGRTPLPPRSTWSEVEEGSSIANQINTILNLETQGATVYLASVDVADEISMSSMLQKLKDQGCPPVRGVVHMAGIPGGRLLLELDATRINEVLRPKVMGGWLLHRLFEKVDLDFFILFSSATHQLGLLSRGVGDYSAANAFLDALADYRKAQGLPAVSIEWGPWAEVGMAARVRNDERLARFGIGSITPDQGLQAMSRALCQNSASIWAIPINWSQLLQMDQLAAKSPFLSNLSRQLLSQEGAALGSQQLNTIKSEILQKLKQHSESERLSILTAYIQGEVAKVLMLEPSKLPDPQQGFFDMGMDSLIAIELKNRLEASFGVSLPVTLTFEFPTIKDVAEYLVREVIVWDISAPKGEDEQAKALSQVEQLSNDGVEASIAIIGMGCRLPGGAHDPDTFWRLMHDGVDAIIEVPRDRWDIDAYYDPDPDAQGKMYTRMGGFLQQQVDQFDPLLFGISAREAASIDPQQRLLLEVSWEALEKAGIAPKSLAGSRTGVFVGIGQNDYAQLQLSSDPTSISVYDGTGNGFCFASGRLSYILGLQGPSVSMDTACSSSLVAIHLACKSLRTGECDMALTGGVQLMLSPGANIFLSRSHALSPDGRCKTFDAAANGFTRGEGCGILVLKRLSDAQAAKDNILAVIRGSAMNHDGSSSGLTVPNGSAQQVLIRQALQDAQVDPWEINYVEAHGTGTSLGDPIEVRALGTVLGEGRSPDNPLVLGSVKTNIGHLEAAAGVAGLIKVVLSLQHNEIPPHLHFKQPNPYINWDELPVVVPKSSMPWLSGEKRRLAGVSSFGMSGTNAHIVLEEAPILKSVKTQVERPLHLLTLSAKTEEALKQLAVRYENHLAAHPSSLNIGDICNTANAGRSHLTHRLAVVASSSAQVCEKLLDFSNGDEPLGLFKGLVSRSPNLTKIAFLFTGQGSQYVGMGHQLYETQPTFRQTLDDCNEILRPYLDRSLLSVLYPEPGETSPIHETAYTQPAIFALEYALVQLWKSWGITPTAVIGHSVGEYVAACVAKVFNLEDGLKLISTRARLMQKLPQDGEMVAVFADITAIRAVAEIDEQKLALAALNGPRNTVISGETQAVRTICNTLELAGITTKKLQTSHAFHSPMMEPILAEFYEVAATVTYAAPQINLISNVTGEPLTSETNFPEYWCRHLRSSVRFADGLKTLHTSGYELFVEIGSKPILLGMGRSCLPEQGVWLPSLRQGQLDWSVLLHSLGELYVRGADIDWSGFERDYRHRRVVLPTYPFQRQRYWVEKAEIEHQQAQPLSQPIQTSIMNQLHQGKIKQLAQQLEGTGNFSQAQMKMLPQLLEVIVAQHQQEIQANAIKDLLYQVEWQQMPQRLQTTRQSSQEDAPGTWVVFADLGGVGQAVGEILLRRGQNCILVYTGEGDQSLKAGTWSINPTSPEDYERLFEFVLGTGVPPLRGIIHLWSLEAALPEELCIPTLEQAQKLGCRSVLYLLQTLLKHHESTSPRLWLVTRGAVPVDSELTGMAQAPLWGLGKVVALEHPELWGGMLDLAPESTGDEASKLLAEIEDSVGEDNLAFRNGDRYVARLVPKQLLESKQVVLRADGTYLITGGLGALGLSVARWMVEQGARQLVLTGRSAASNEAQSTLKALEQLGAKVLVQKADVSHQGDMVRVLEVVQATMPPLRGIVHAAGVPGYEAIKDMELSTLESVLRPKVVGTWILHQLTQEMKLEFFVSFSSIASVWGSKGQAHYAAANHFLDVLAHYRQGLGLPALTVNWGPWAGGGMAVEEFQTWMSRMGVESLPREQAIAALAYLLGSGCVQTTVANVDWILFKEVYEARRKRPLLELLEGQSQKAPLQKQSVRRSDILPRLERTQNGDRLDLLVVHLQEQITKLLGLGASLTLDPEQPLLELGFDSLMAVELRNAIATDLEVNVPIEKFINGSNIMQLAELLLQELVLENTIQPSPFKNDLEVIEQSTEVPSTSFDFASVAISNQDSWVKGEL